MYILYNNISNFDFMDYQNTTTLFHNLNKNNYNNSNNNNNDDDDITISSFIMFSIIGFLAFCLLICYLYIIIRNFIYYRNHLLEKPKNLKNFYNSNIKLEPTDFIKKVFQIQKLHHLKNNKADIDIELGKNHFNIQ
jgi:ATP-dependent Zn protease